MNKGNIIRAGKYAIIGVLVALLLIGLYQPNMNLFGVNNNNITPYGLTATLTATPTNGSAPLNVSFTVVVSGLYANTTASKYVWNFGEGSAITTTTPSTYHVYNTNGTYNASVTAVTASGNVTSNIVQITVGHVTSPPSSTTSSSSPSEGVLLEALSVIVIIAAIILVLLVVTRRKPKNEEEKEEGDKEEENKEEEDKEEDKEEESKESEEKKEDSN
jgi:beta-lactamase regulating signal transducer with metallopeptidase domain